MLGLILMLLVVFFSLAILLWAGTLFTQGYIYSEPEADLYWRAPAAAGVLAAFLAFWCYLDYSAADVESLQPAYNNLFQFNPTESKTVDKFWSVRGEEEFLYSRATGGTGRIEYVNSQGIPWRREDVNGVIEAVVIEEGGAKVRFEARLTKGKQFEDSGQYPPYYEKGGRRVMEPIGQVSIFRYGQFFLNLFLNFAHLGVWFVCLWLILRFQWTHALLGAVVIWVVMMLVVLPMLLERSMVAGRERAGRVPSSALVAPAHESLAKLRA